MQQIDRPSRVPSTNTLAILTTFLPFSPSILASILLLIGSFLPRFVLIPAILYISAPPLYRLAAHKWAWLPRLGLKAIVEKDQSGLVKGRTMGVIEGDFVVFMIGNRINEESAWVSGSAEQSGAAMDAMQNELKANPDLGCLHTEYFVSTDPSGAHYMAVQYWRSLDQLHAYSRGRMFKHLEPMMKNIAMQRTSSEVGIYHETYMVRAGEYECVYGNMPPFGLGIAGRLERVGGKRTTMKQRLGKLEQPDFVENDPRKGME
ncbi:hypothetical protein DFJ77DRAFT_449602 [Powellomyces hirtus]|nr:hypothetical protein DFJ77DRAFT_449602 [Powellomyces hirtus]